MSNVFALVIKRLPDLYPSFISEMGVLEEEEYWLFEPSFISTRLRLVISFCSLNDTFLIRSSIPFSEKKVFKSSRSFSVVFLLITAVISSDCKLFTVGKLYGVVVNAV